MKAQIIIFYLLFIFFLPATAQQTRSLSEQMQTVRVLVDDDPTLPPVTRLGSSVEISFDELSHAYHRYIYRVTLCNADWSEATDIFESDWLEGFNERPIEDCEPSFNTSTLYTHYRFRLPNEDVRLLLPGNYRVQVYDDDDPDKTPVLEACFSLFVPEMSIAATVSTNTDVDFNRTHQQVTWSLSYGRRSVVDPQRELRTVVMQNRRRDNAVINLPPNIQRSTGVEWTHRRELVFDAGAEYHKFELLDVRRVGLGVDRMVWEEPIYHAVLFPREPLRNYDYSPDANGISVVRRSGSDNPDTEAEYVIVHFSLHTPPLPGGDVYVTGAWDNGFPDPRCRMAYDELSHAYEVGVLLKQGYYNYQFLQPGDDGCGHTDHTTGNFYETENEYIILVYHRPQGARYDALVGYSKVKNEK